MEVKANALRIVLKFVCAAKVKIDISNRVS
jgi:hypothetical protein